MLPFFARDAHSIALHKLHSIQDVTSVLARLKPELLPNKFKHIEWKSVPVIFNCQHLSLVCYTGILYIKSSVEINQIKAPEINKLLLCTTYTSSAQIS